MNSDFALLLTEMRNDFLEELPGRCRYIEERILAMERLEPDAFDDLYRQVHSLKGSGATFGLSLLTTVCHQFESFLGETGQLFDQKTAHFALNYVDLLRQTGLAPEREGTIRTSIERNLEQLRGSAITKPLSVLLVEPSSSIHRICKIVLTRPTIRLVALDQGLSALAALLNEPFDLLVASRELSVLNSLALVAAIRESGCRNRNIPVILISSNATPPPAYLGIKATIFRNPQLADTLAHYVDEILAL